MHAICVLYQRGFSTPFSISYQRMKSIAKRTVRSFIMHAYNQWRKDWCWNKNCQANRQNFSFYSVSWSGHPENSSVEVYFKIKLCGICKQVDAKYKNNMTEWAQDRPKRTQVVRIKYKYTKTFIRIKLSNFFFFSFLFLFYFIFFLFLAKGRILFSDPEFNSLLLLKSIFCTHIYIYIYV